MDRLKRIGRRVQVSIGKVISKRVREGKYGRQVPRDRVQRVCVEHVTQYMVRIRGVSTERVICVVRNLYTGNRINRDTRVSKWVPKITKHQ